MTAVAIPIAIFRIGVAPFANEATFSSSRSISALTYRKWRFVAGDGIAINTGVLKIQFGDIGGARGAGRGGVAGGRGGGKPA
jgi:hypothetical protein